MSFTIDLVEQGHVPDVITRLGIRRLIRKRLRQEQQRYRDPGALAAFVEGMHDSPLAIATAEANVQHYEVPTEFFNLVLGNHRKYSCCYFKPHVRNISTAEEAMLALSCERARLADGLQILELGCGWGSLTLWLAEHYPASHVTAVSNSATQKAYIEMKAADRGLENLTVITCDMNDFDINRQFDRVMSIEMFEHMRNHPLLFERISRWLKPGGLLWYHVFCHRLFPYFFEVESQDDWMAKNFFTGGIMPAWDLPLQFSSSLQLADRWAVGGEHYAKTCRAWLNLADAHRDQILEVFQSSEDPTPAVILLNRWRMFFMACEELFAWNQGREYHVAHYLWRNP